MKKRKLLFFTVAILLLISSCRDDSFRVDDYLVEFATTKFESNTYHFILDNGEILTPEKIESFNGKTGQRVLLNYILLKGNRIQIRHILPIFTGHIETNDLPSQNEIDPVKLQSVWIGGNYLNLIFEVEYHSKAHSISLVRDISSSSPEIHLLHSRNDDLRGYQRIMHASFNLESLRSEFGETSIPLIFHIKTYSGFRQINLTYQPMPKEGIG